MIRNVNGVGWLLFLAGCSTFSAATSAPEAVAAEVGKLKYRSPEFLAVSPDGSALYVSDSSAGNVTWFDTASGEKRGEILLQGTPLGLAVSAAVATLYVAEDGAGTVAAIDLATGSLRERVAVGRWPAAVACSHDGRRLYVGNHDNHTVSVVDLSPTGSGKVIQHLPVVRSPVSLAATPDDRQVVVANQLPQGVATDPNLAAEVTILDARSLVPAASIRLPAGSTMAQGVCVSPTGRWAYVVHGLGRFQSPVTQLERGWVNTYALSILDLNAQSRLATVLLDQVAQGAADPHSVLCSPDGRRLWISHSGVHEISFVDLGLVHSLLDGAVPEELEKIEEGDEPNIWVRIRQDRRRLPELEYQLNSLDLAGAIRRVPSGGQVPRGLALSPDGHRLYVANWISGSVAVLDATDGRLLQSLSLGEQPAADAARRGQFIFHDANHAFQRWHSCASCHANEGRTDGLRWDFLVDGAGNGKDTLSLVNLHHTEPMTRRGLFASAHERTRGGLESTNGLAATAQDVDDLFAYLTGLTPKSSPRRTSDGELSAAARRGQLLFEGRAACQRCHPAPYFTDKKMHNVGVLSEHYLEQDGRYDTPSLIEAYRTAPYLHDGRALTIREVLTVHDPSGRHGAAKNLTEQELGDLAEYVLSL